MKIVALMVAVWIFVLGMIAALMVMQQQTDLKTRDTFQLNLPDGEIYTCYAYGSDVRCDFWDN